MSFLFSTLYPESSSTLCVNFMGPPQWHSDKESAFSAGEQEPRIQSLGQEDPLE